MILTHLSVLALLSVLIVILHVCCPVNGIDCLGYNQPKVFNTPCGDSKCSCSSSEYIAMCADLGANLTYIPQLPSSVRVLIFKNNSLPIVSQKTFQNVSSNITDICFLHTGIVQMANDTFQNLVSLLTIGIEDNHNINQHDLANTFRNLQNQHAIKIQLINIGLVNLSMSLLENLKTKKVMSIDLSRNLLEQLNLDAFAQLESLQVLRLSSCRLWRVDVVSGHRTLEELDLSNNKLGYYQPDLCNSERTSIFPRLMRLNLRENWLHELSVANWDCLQMLQYLDISNNYIIVIQTNTFAELRSLLVLYLSNMYTGISEMQKAAFNNSQLEVIMLISNGIKFKSDMANSMFDNCPSVERVFLSRNNFYHMSDSDILQMFSPLKHLIELTIESAYMRLPEGFLELFPNLRKLNLASNRHAISDVGVSFKSTTSLKDLSLKGNSIKVVPQESFNGVTMGSIQSIDLAGNPFSCSCEMLWFRNAIDKDGNIGKIKLKGWPNDYSCDDHKQYAHVKYPLFADYSPSKFSCQRILHIALISLSSFLVLVMSLAIVVYKYRWYIAYFAYKLKSRRSSPETQPLLDNEGDPTREGEFYDGYIIYNDADCKYVHNELRLLLEVRFGYKLHIWDRDAFAGQDKVSVIADAIYASKQVVAVISEKVLDDTWFQFQLNVAVDRQLDLKRDFLILILLEDIKYEQMSKFWCVMITRLFCTRWCSDESNVKRQVFEQQLQQHFRCT